MLQKTLKSPGWTFWPQPPLEVRPSLERMLFGRLGVLFVLLVVVVLYQILGEEQSATTLGLGYGILTFAFAFNLFHALWIDRLPEKRWVIACQILVDASLISVWVAVSQSRESYDALLYLIQILIVSLVFYQRWALFAAFAASLAYGMLLMGPGTALSTALLGWASYSGLFFTLGLVGGYLSEEVFRTNQKLREKQEKIEKLTEVHEQVLNELPTGLLTVDEQMRVAFVNPAAQQILGKPVEAIMGKKLDEVESGLLPFFTQIPTEPVEGEDQEVAATGDEHHRSFFVSARSRFGSARLQQIVEIGSGFSQRVLRGDVADIDLHFDLKGANTNGRVLLFQDVTKIVHLEDKVKQHEKLAAVGQLAAGIAHEIRNPLASMSASIEMLRDTVPADTLVGDDKQLMDIAVREIDRLNDLISEFLEYVRPEKMVLERVDLSALIQEVVLGVKNQKEARTEVALQTELPASPIHAHGNASRLRQVLWNLVLNAVQSIPETGQVEVGCASVSSKKVRFWVKDSGQGMTDEVLKRLYEPFFTTKSKGTGLGLAMVYKIIEAHQGEIKVSSRQGKGHGTTFEVILRSA